MNAENPGGRSLHLMYSFCSKSVLLPYTFFKRVFHRSWNFEAQWSVPSRFYFFLPLYTKEQTIRCNEAVAAMVWGKDFKCCAAKEGRSLTCDEHSWNCWCGLTIPWSELAKGHRPFGSSPMEAEHICGLASAWVTSWHFLLAPLSSVCFASAAGAMLCLFSLGAPQPMHTAGALLPHGACWVTQALDHCPVSCSAATLTQNVNNVTLVRTANSWKANGTEHLPGRLVVPQHALRKESSRAELTGLGSVNSLANLSSLSAILELSSVWPSCSVFPSDRCQLVHSLDTQFSLR